MEQYPKVKVREEEDDDQFSLELTSLQSLKGFLSFSPYDSFPDDSPTSVVKIPGSFVSSSATSEDPTIRDGSPTSIMRLPDSFTSTSTTCEDSAPKETITKKETESGRNKTNTRANLASRPRAVLSSPDNDSMIGNTNKTRKEPLSTVKNHSLCQNRHTQCKAMHRSGAKGHISSKPRAAMLTGRGKNDLHAGGQLVTKDPSKISSHLKGKTELPRRKTSSKPTDDK